MSRNFLKYCRIRTTSEFQRIYLERRCFSEDYFSLYCQNNSFGYSRLGIVASRKSLKKSTMRNRAKRIVREGFRTLGYFLPSLDVVFVVKSQSEKASKKELRKCIDRLLLKLIKYSLRELAVF
ncbi:ribonuclease P protein component [Coxiella endosymbiont of Amblyomma sculptum]|uniref:ribonuclease P protein component n=1 Tax=Coxiella endosymbiont of Amblyomma sculptum TaxID=2487929 RepID=UPI001357C16C|nr:ribonuclease P protein component [Coxiella endosymbiont of Amblyomma sculptum]